MIEKGLVYYLTDSIIFLLCGYAIHIGIGRYLGVAPYGIFSVIVSLSTMTYVFFNYGVRTSITKLIAEDTKMAYPIFISGLKIQAFCGLIITGLILIFADIVANILNDPNLASLIRLSSIGVLPLALFEVYLGLFNGKKEFGKNAAISILYSLTKLFFVFVLVLIGYRVKGAIFGYMAAGLVGLIVSVRVTRFDKITKKISVKRILQFSIPLVIFSMGTSLLMNIDLLLIKAILKDNEAAGIYSAASTLSRPLWFLSSAFAGVLLPMVSASTIGKNITETRAYINHGLRYAFMILMPIATLLSGTADRFVEILYSAGFKSAGNPLSILIFGFLFFSLFSIYSTIIAGIGRPGLALFFMLLIIPLDIVLNIILIPLYQTSGAAISTSITFFLGLLMVGGYIFLQFRATLKPASFFRISIASFILYILTNYFRANGLELIGQIFLLLIVYIILLIALKEIRRDDLIQLKRSAMGIINLRYPKSQPKSDHFQSY